MEENNFEFDIASLSKNFDNKTLRYRINAFVYACNIRLDPNDIKADDKRIRVSENNTPFGKSITIGGEYKDLNFFFANYYENEKLDKKIIDLPFSILLTKYGEKELYGLNIETINGKKTEFVIYRNNYTIGEQALHNNVRFVSNIIDFSQVLKLIKNFVDNPKIVFDTYNDIACKYECYFTKEDLEKGIMEDENLDKPTGKIRKLCKKMRN